jgi:purine-binding chemotaxis protein CheW
MTEATSNIAPVDEKKSTGEKLRYIQFSLGDEDYAIPLLTVREVIPVPETTPIPNSPSYYCGIMNLRGQVISIVDLRKKLKLPELENESETAVVIVDLSGVHIGIIVDSINKVLTFDQEQMNELPEIDSQINSEYILGVYRQDTQLTVIIDVAKILDVQDIVQKQEQAS